MRNSVQKYIFGVSLVAFLSLTAPAIATVRNTGAPHDFFSRVRNVIAHILDVVDNKLTLPPG